MQLLSRTHGTNKVYLFYSFSWIKIQTKTKDLHVTNFVDIATRIPKHLDLHFSDFLRISRHFQSSQQEIKKT